MVYFGQYYILWFSYPIIMVVWSLSGQYGIFAPIGAIVLIVFMGIVGIAESMPIVY